MVQGVEMRKHNGLLGRTNSSHCAVGFYGVVAQDMYKGSGHYRKHHIGIDKHIACNFERIGLPDGISRDKTLELEVLGVCLVGRWCNKYCNEQENKDIYSITIHAKSFNTNESRIAQEEIRLVK